MHLRDCLPAGVRHAAPVLVLALVLVLPLLPAAVLGAPAGEADPGMPVDGGIIKKAADAVSNIKIAAELNWGVTGNDKSVNVEVKNKQRLVYAESGEKLMYEMETKAAKLTNGVKGGIKLYQRLLAGPVANMLNAKIADAKAGGVEAKLNIGEDSYPAFEDQMRAARDASASSYVSAASGFGASLSFFAIHRMKVPQSLRRVLGRESSATHLSAGNFSVRPM